MDMLTQELRLSFRKVWRNPFLSSVVILSLGLSIGAVTAVFNVVDAFLIRPLPIDDIQRVVRVRENYAPPGEDPQLRSVSATNYYLWKDMSDVFSGMAAGTYRDLAWTGGDEPERISGAAVTASFFSVLGIQPILGRTFRPEEDTPGSGGGVVLLSHRVWTERFGGTRDVLGKRLILNGTPHTVVGVMPRGLHHPYEADMWVPLQLANDPTDTWGLYVPARLAPGMTLERAQSILDHRVARLRTNHPQQVPPWTAQLSPLRKELVSDLDELLYLLLAAAGFVLLIACANVANLLLARSMGESVDVAIQTALGASQWRLFRQSLIFSSILGLMGGAVGVLLAFWSVGPLVSLAPVYGLGEFDIAPRMDWVTLAFTVLLSILVGILFGLIPAFRTRRRRLQTDLREAWRGGGLGLWSRRVLSAFVVAQIALAVAVLMAAGLMYRSLDHMVAEDRGFDMTDVLSFEVAFPEARYPGRAERVEFVHKAIQSLAHLPGVTSVGATTTQPLYPGTWSAGFNVEGHPAENPRGVHVVHTRTVTPDYLATLKVPLLAGRMLEERDGPDSPPVVVISRSMAERYWPGEDPIGKRVKRGQYDSDNPWVTVVGVVGTLQETQDESVPFPDAWYLPYRQEVAPPFDSIVFTLRTAGSPQTLAQPARRAISAIDPGEPIYDVKTMEERLYDRTTSQRFSTLLYAGLGLLGLVLATLGIYGVLSYSVARRVREIGVRAALGAAPRDLERMVFRQSAVLVTTGLVLGAATALYFSPYIEDQLHRVQPRDPLSLGLSLAGLAALALVLTWIPARRAARIDPATALRQD